MKKPILALITITGLLAAGQVQSQTDTNNMPMGHHHGWMGMSPEERMNKLSEKLNLSETQKPQVQAVFDQMRQKMQAAMQEAKTNADAQLQSILTPEQYQQFQAMWEQHRQRMEHHWGSGSNTNETNESNGQQ